MDLFFTQNNELSYVNSLINGILTFVSPCILPMLPIYYSYLAGGGADDANNEEENKGRLLLNSVGFVLGFSIIFLLLGAVATSLGSFLGKHRAEFMFVSGIIIIIFGLNFLGVFKIGILNLNKRFEYKFDRLRFFSSIVFGMVFAFGWSGCTVAYLTPVMALAADSKRMVEGLMYLGVYSLGLGIPFIISSLIFKKLKGAFKFMKRHSRIISILSGIYLLYSGINMIYSVSYIFN